MVTDCTDAPLRECLIELDGLIYREILRLRARYQLSLDEFRGLYISDEQVDALAAEYDLRRSGGAPEPDHFAKTVRPLLERLPRYPPFSRLAERFGFSPLEVLLLFIAAAPGIETKYETLFAYLNNDVSCKTASIELMVRLVASEPDEALSVRRALSPGAALPATGLIRVHFARDHPVAGAQRALVAAHPGLPDYLLGLPFKDHVIEHLLQHRRPNAVDRIVATVEAVQSLAARLSRSISSDKVRPLFIEPHSTLSCRTFALALCSGQSRVLIILDLRPVPKDALPDTIARALLVAQLRDAVLLIDGIESLLTEARISAEASALRVLLRAIGTPVLVDAPSPAATHLPFEPFEYRTLALPGLSRSLLMDIWRESIRECGIEAAESDLEEVVLRFPLGAELIRAIARTLADEAPNATRATRMQLFAAARAQADSGLGRVAQRVRQRYTWDDLVLPATTRSRIRSFIDALKSRERVLEDWGMARALGTVGLRALFAGPSGTGKTMTAGVVAHELGVDVYRVDLSQTVSKYIGETEKNLERIFQAAERAHAILFFDEADALLGKRSEVKDAHDRYANIEVAYLLQRLEDFAGIVIVATNVSRNIDTAFSRRMQFVVEFPLPGVGERERLWRSMFPSTAPMAADVDFDFLSRRFELAGGDIRNVALEAAFLAASSAQSISMRHVAQALAHELVKQGRSPSITEFKQHYALLESFEQAG